MSKLLRLAAVTLLHAALLFTTLPARADDLPDFTALVDHYASAVVSISTTGKTEPANEDRTPHDKRLPNPFEGTPFEEPFRHFFDQRPEQRTPRSTPSSIGSGFIVSADGYILTNAHVVDGAERVTVGMNDRTEHVAEVVGSDPRSDIALLKIQAKDLPTVKIGDSDALRVGQWVLAIGSPFGFESSATVGIVSAVGRSLPTDNYVPFIQTDAAVNPGNSGGPLFNRSGEVIGVNSQIYSRSGGYLGLSFAIPIKVAMNVAEQLKTRGRVARGWLGVLIQEVTPDLAKSFGLDRPRGALIGQVMDDGPGAKNGLKAGDIVLEFDGHAISRSGELPPLVGASSPGKEATLQIFRDGAQTQIKVQIGELPDDVAVNGRSAASGEAHGLGLEVTELPAEQRTQGDSGVVVREVRSGPAQSAGIRTGDVIVRVNNQAITGPAQFATVIRQLPRGKPVAVLIRRDDNALFLPLTLPE